jgi:putative ABC transport system permease protein
VALAVGTLIVEILSRTALAAAEQLTRRMSSVGIPFAFRHGLRRLTRRGLESRVMLFTLAGGLALLISVGTTREGFSRVLSISQSNEAPDLFLMDVQPEQVRAAKALVAPYSRSAAIFAPLVHARLTHINGEALKRGDLRRDAGSARDQKQARSREYNLTYADELNPSETLIAGKEWPIHSQTAEASLEREFAKRAGLKMGSVLTFDVSGRDVTATVTSLRRVEWASMRPNFFVTLSPSLISSAPQTFIASFKSRDLAASAAVRRELAEKIPNISVIDAAALLGTVRRTLDLMLTAIETLAWFCVFVGVLVVAGLVALSRSQRSADNALERVLGFSRRDTLLADIAELLGLGALSVLCGLSAAIFLAWSLSSRFDLPLVFNWRELILMLIAALLLPTLSGLLAGSASRHAPALDAFRQEN